MRTIICLAVLTFFLQTSGNCETFHNITKEDNNFRINYKRTIKDINDKDVVILSSSHIKSFNDMADEIDVWTKKRNRAIFMINKLEAERDAANSIN